MDTPANQGKLTRAADIQSIFHLILTDQCAQTLHVFTCIPPGCMHTGQDVKHDARYLMVTHLQGLPGRSVFRLMWNILKICRPAETDPHMLKSCGYTDPQPYHLGMPPESFNLIPTRLLKILLLHGHPQIKSN